MSETNSRAPSSKSKKPLNTTAGFQTDDNTASFILNLPQACGVDLPDPISTTPARSSRRGSHISRGSHTLVDLNDKGPSLFLLKFAPSSLSEFENNLRHTNGHESDCSELSSLTSLASSTCSKSETQRLPLPLERELEREADSSSSEDKNDSDKDPDYLNQESEQDHNLKLPHSITSSMIQSYRSPTEDRNSKMRAQKADPNGGEVCLISGILDTPKHLESAHLVAANVKSKEILQLNWAFGHEPGYMHPDSHENKLLLGHFYHSTFDCFRWTLLPESDVIDKLVEHAKQLQMLDLTKPWNQKEDVRTHINTAYKETEYYKENRHFAYHFAPRLEYHRSRTIQKVHKDENGEEICVLHAYPFRSLYPLKCHALPHYVLANLGKKLTKRKLKRDEAIQMAQNAHNSSLDDATALIGKIEYLYGTWTNLRIPSGFSYKGEKKRSAGDGDGEDVPSEFKPEGSRGPKRSCTIQSRNKSQSGGGGSHPKALGSGGQQRQLNLDVSATTPKLDGGRDCGPSSDCDRWTASSSSSDSEKTVYDDEDDDDEDDDDDDEEEFDYTGYLRKVRERVASWRGKFDLGCARGRKQKGSASSMDSLRQYRLEKSSKAHQRLGRKELRRKNSVLFTTNDWVAYHAKKDAAQGMKQSGRSER